MDVVDQLEQTYRERERREEARRFWRRMCLFGLVFAVIVWLAVILALAVKVQAAEAKAKPAVVMILHGGGFVFGSPPMEVPPYVRAHGMVPRSVRYTLGDAAAAMQDAKAEARRLRRRGRTVYAYGESAGGVLSARLGQMGAADRAVSWMGPPDLLTLTHPVVDGLVRSAGSEETLRRLSPGQYRSRRPILAQIAREDAFIDHGQQLGWAALDPRVWPQIWEGNHLTPPEPQVRMQQLHAAMAFLDRKEQQWPRRSTRSQLPLTSASYVRSLRSTVATSRRCKVHYPYRPNDHHQGARNDGEAPLQPQR